MDLEALARAHIDAENKHDIELTMDTIGPDGAHYVDFPNADTFTSREAIEQYYLDAYNGIPDMRVEPVFMISDPVKKHVFVQYVFSGRQTAAWHGLPATNRVVRFHGGILYAFDDNGKLIKEEQYYDKTEILASVGLIRDANTKLGQFLLLFFQSPFYTLKAAFISLFGKKKTSPH